MITPKRLLALIVKWLFISVLVLFCAVFVGDELSFQYRIRSPNQATPFGSRGHAAHAGHPAQGRQSRVHPRSDTAGANRRNASILCSRTPASALLVPGSPKPATYPPADILGISRGLGSAQDRSALVLTPSKALRYASLRLPGEEVVRRGVLSVSRCQRGGDGATLISRSAASSTCSTLTESMVAE